jgi:ketosteroid isomerase-like protein
MRTWLALCLALWLTTALVGCANTTTTTPTTPTPTTSTTAQRPPSAIAANDEADIRRLLTDRVARRFDAATLRARVADDVAIVDEKGTVTIGRDGFVDSYTQPIPPVVELHESVDEIRVRVVGDAAIATYRHDSHLVLGGAPVLKSRRVSETFVRAPDGWKTVAFQETIIPGMPVAHDARPESYDDFVGRYQLFPGYVYQVKREGDRLEFGATYIRELMPDGPDAFVCAGDPTHEGFGYRVRFVRENGRVTRLRIIEFPGVEYDAMRLPNGAP